MIARVTGSKTEQTFRKLYEKVKHLKGCIFYADSWDVFTKVLPKDCHIIGKQHTFAIERGNINTHNDLARFTRRTKVVSVSKKMVNNTLKLWQAFQSSDLFSFLQQFAYLFLSKISLKISNYYNL